MSIQYKNYAKQASTSSTTVHTVSAGQSEVISSVLVANVSDGDATITVHLVPSGSSSSTSNLYVSGKSVPANSEITLDILVNQILMEGQKFMVTGSASNALNVRLSTAVDI